MILVRLDSKDPQGRKVWPVRKVRLAGRAPLDRPALPDRKGKLDCKDPRVLKASAEKSAHLAHRAKRVLPEKRDLPDLPDPQGSEEKQDLPVLQDQQDPPGLREPQLPLQPPTFEHSRSTATLLRVRPTKCWFPQSART